MSGMPGFNPADLPAAFQPKAAPPPKGSPEAIGNKAAQLIRVKQFDLADAELRRGIQKHPKSFLLHRLVGELRFGQGEYDQALYFFERAVALKGSAPGPFLYNLLGATCVRLVRLEDARKYFIESLTNNPKPDQARANCGTACQQLGRYTEALEHFEHALDLAPSTPTNYTNLAGALISLGRTDEAVEMLRDGLIITPGHPELQQTLCGQMNYLDHVSEEEILSEHRRLGEVFSAVASQAPSPVFANDRSPDRRIRIGYLSPDLRNHSVGYFIEPLLAGHDRERFDVFCYYTNQLTDDASERMSGLDLTWRSCPLINDQQLAELIRKDKIDVLIECSGMMQGNRHRALMLRPAPVQVTYCGYPNVTGLAHIDARFVDSATDPDDALAIEPLVRLDPCFLCYRPPEDCPDPAPVPPSTTSGRVTFGSFNHAMKISPATVDLWARVLDTVPGSRLVLKTSAFKFDEVVAEFRGRFERAGVRDDRLEILPATPTRSEHLETYALVDVALDTFPYHGTTTTVEAMMMGVPTVARLGPGHRSRVALSLLRAVGLEDLAAESDDAFVEAAAKLAADAPRLKGLRASLRGALLASALCDAPAFVARFESACRDLWRAWCERGEDEFAFDAPVSEFGPSPMVGDIGTIAQQRHPRDRPGT